MRAQKVLARNFQFYFPDLDNILLVESLEDEMVTIRATKNNVSEQRKIFFIRKLAAEGFIPDRYEWFCGSTDGSSGVTWIKDLSWLEIPKVVTRRSNAFICRLLVAACVLLGCVMRVLLVSNPDKVTQKKPVATFAVSHAPFASQSRFLSLVPQNPLTELQGKH